MDASLPLDRDVLFSIRKKEMALARKCSRILTRPDGSSLLDLERYVARQADRRGKIVSGRKQNRSAARFGARVDRGLNGRSVVRVFVPGSSVLEHIEGCTGRGQRIKERNKNDGVGVNETGLFHYLTPSRKVRICQGRKEIGGETFPFSRPSRLTSMSGTSRSS